MSGFLPPSSSSQTGDDPSLFNDPRAISGEAIADFNSQSFTPTLPQAWDPSQAHLQQPVPVTFEHASKDTSKGKRKQSGTEHIKHRRTRSGCYTCRSRRVKCDETHPRCERCRKGGRECVYPENVAGSKAPGSTTTKSTHSKPTSIPEEGSSPDSSDEQDKETLLVDLEEAHSSIEALGSSLPSGSKHTVSRASDKDPSVHTQQQTGFTDTPELSPSHQEGSPTPSTDGSASYTGSRSSTSRTPAKHSASSPDTSETSNVSHSRWPHLRPDLQYYLEYSRSCLSHHHYSFKHDTGNWMRTTFLDIASKNEPLLYAVVGFSAFQHTLQQPNGRIQDFLGYYNKSVSLLRMSLQRNQKHTTATLLTILQLATVEEFLGDWVNLLGHQKAAYEILTKLYNPQTILQSDTQRRILNWYARFDLFAGLMSGYGTVLGREWFFSIQQFFLQQSQQDPNDIDSKIEEKLASSRLLATDMAQLFASKARETVTHDEFLQGHEQLSQRFMSWRDNIDPALVNPEFLVNEFKDSPPLDPDDIVNPYLPGILYHGPLWTMNFAFLDWYAIWLMFKYQTILHLQLPPSQELGMLAMTMCQLFEAIELYPHKPPGAMITAQASLGIASLFLPKDDRHTMWCRRKLAVIESTGWIYPQTFRNRMSTLWSEPDVDHWWLPNDEGYSDILRSIRAFVQDRTAKPKDHSSEDVRDIKAIFGKMQVHSNPGSPSDERMSTISSNSATMPSTSPSASNVDT
ncbi:hypothetical protein L228DRAFT_265867 [Xylona heveae TC161]|uniref:Zn(2)-C6 fungal-type domain-containing protein n=1 Tax=Xylona heveae (strain CBS 132557 / TC161) TaxID=1328760 RepID=A0A165IU89_XYLHT|nr:hypothetical protein L228DRAFT_265867 [Xylona heveae TC161]KZF25398.1 hypothetical protein L228DRAFT_265867 [Xylona heveae TC161]